MKELEKGQDKIEKICQVLREETLEPAKQQGEHIIAEAKSTAADIIKKAEKHAEKLLQEAKQAIQREKSVLSSSLLQAGKQGLESLRQDIEQKLFSQEVSTLVQEGSADPKLIAKLVNSLVKAIEREGIKTDLTAVIPQAVPAEEVSAALTQKTLQHLKGQTLEVGKFTGGAQLKVHEKKLTIDISDEALQELLSQYVRKDFRKQLFGDGEGK